MLKPGQKVQISKDALRWENNRQRKSPEAGKVTTHSFNKSIDRIKI